MSTTSGVTHTSPSRLQATGIAWLVGSVPVALGSWLLVGLSESTAGAVAGGILGALTLGAWAVGTWLLRRPGAAARRGSLALSLGWLVGALAVLPTQEYAADALWAAGVPALVAVVTAGLAWRRS